MPGMKSGPRPQTATPTRDGKMGSEEPDLDGPLDGLCPRRCFELGIDRLRLGSDRVAGDEKLDGDEIAQLGARHRTQANPKAGPSANQNPSHVGQVDAPRRPHQRARPCRASFIQTGPGGSGKPAVEAGRRPRMRAIAARRPRSVRSWTANTQHLAARTRGRSGGRPSRPLSTTTRCAAPRCRAASAHAPRLASINASWALRDVDGSRPPRARAVSTAARSSASASSGDPMSDRATPRSSRAVARDGLLGGSWQDHLGTRDRLLDAIRHHERRRRTARDARGPSSCPKGAAAVARAARETYSLPRLHAGHRMQPRPVEQIAGDRWRSSSLNQANHSSRVSIRPS